MDKISSILLFKRKSCGCLVGLFTFRRSKLVYQKRFSLFDQALSSKYSSCVSCVINVTYERQDKEDLTHSPFEHDVDEL